MGKESARNSCRKIEGEHMLKVVNLKLSDINELVRLTADKMKLPPSMVEKDFWVSYMLEYMFNRFEYKHLLEFKGGTSLSKGYNLIERFSEDIDVVLNLKVLDVSEAEFNKAKSKNKQDEFNKNLLSKSYEFLKNDFYKMIKQGVGVELIHPHEFIFNEEDASISFKYPQIYQDPTLLQEIRLEVGALASWTPFEVLNTKSFIAKYYSGFFNTPEFNVLTTQAKRTFWEKIVILHKEAHRRNGKTPNRYSRHYYDVYKMIQSNIKDQALNDLELLKDVVDFNIKFYPTNWANFEDAKIGTFKLIPSDETLVKLSKDYDDMQSMLYGDKPTFAKIIDEIKEFENLLNLQKV